MCYQELETLICATCDRTIRDIPTSISPCGNRSSCSGPLSRHTGVKQVQKGVVCGVCAGKQEESARKAAELRKFGKS